MGGSRILADATVPPKEDNFKKFKKLLETAIFPATQIDLKNYRSFFQGDGMDLLKGKEKSSINQSTYVNFSNKMK